MVLDQNAGAVPLPKNAFVFFVHLVLRQLGDQRSLASFICVTDQSRQLDGILQAIP
ncbi:hypothetical protein D3C73_1020420 [compost metagenome]